MKKCTPKSLAPLGRIATSAGCWRAPAARRFALARALARPTYAYGLAMPPSLRSRSARRDHAPAKRYGFLLRKAGAFLACAPLVPCLPRCSALYLFGARFAPFSPEPPRITPAASLSAPARRRAP